MASSYTILDNATTDVIMRDQNVLPPHIKIYVQIALYVQLTSYSHIGFLCAHFSKSTP